MLKNKRGDTNIKMNMHMHQDNLNKSSFSNKTLFYAKELNYPDANLFWLKIFLRDYCNAKGIQEVTLK